jgi:bacteriorhodopsin
LADIHITTHGSDWFWTAFAIFTLTAITIIFFGFRRPATGRFFHYTTAIIAIVAAINYFTLASDLGFVPVPVEWKRSGKTSGHLRQVFYTRYIDWFITTPLILLNLLLSAAVPWSQVIFVVFISTTTVICGLIGALVPSTYKWGYFAIGLALFSYVYYVIAIPGRQNAAAIGPDVSRIYTISGLWLLSLWILYPICWGVSEGGNVITPDSEAAFYGVIDVLTKVGFSALLLWGHRDVDPARLGLRIRAYDELPSAAAPIEKNGHVPTAPVV